MFLEVAEFLVSWLVLPRLLQWVLPLVLGALGVQGLQDPFFSGVLDGVITVLLFMWRRFLGWGFLAYDITSRLDILGLLRDWWP